MAGTIRAAPEADLTRPTGETWRAEAGGGQVNGLSLDTCAMIWAAQGETLSEDARARIEAEPLHVCAISAWELGTLAGRNRIRPSMPALKWFDTFLERSGSALIGLDAAVLVASTELAGEPPADPADRMIIAAARSRDLALVTRDAAILDYGRSGRVRTLAC